MIFNHRTEYEVSPVSRFHGTISSEDQYDLVIDIYAPHGAVAPQSPEGGVTSVDAAPPARANLNFAYSARGSNGKSAARVSHAEMESTPIMWFPHVTTLHQALGEV